MKLSARYGLATIGALALLSLVHWARLHHRPESAVLRYFLGVSPNLLAAVAIPFVMLGAWADQNPVVVFSKARRWCVISTIVSATGLIAWEFLQHGSRRLVFDPHDIGATIVGACLAIGIFHWVTPRGA